MLVQPRPYRSSAGHRRDDFVEARNMRAIVQLEMQLNVWCLNLARQQ